jgi:hypothetical protein
LLLTERIIVQTVGLFLVSWNSDWFTSRSGTRACSPAVKIPSTNFGKR